MQITRIISFVMLLVLLVSFYVAKVSVALHPPTRNSNLC